MYTPFPILNQFVVPCPALTIASWLEYMFCRRQVSKVRWYRIPISWRIVQFTVIHTVKTFAQWRWSRCFSGTVLLSMTYWMLAIWLLVSLPFLNPTWTSGSSCFTYSWSLAWRTLSITLLACEMSEIVGRSNVLWHCPSLELEWKLIFSSPVATAEFS